MVHIPFHRKVLPWLFTVVFLIMAPAVIFYTSGYRWNPKKNAIERNGTLIIDTQPAGASIKLNGQTIPETSSVTLQNMAPGSYDVELNLKGYYPWNKTLWIGPERVTFASNIILWPRLDPQYLGDIKITRLLSNTDMGLCLAAMINSDQTTIFGLLDPKTGQILKRSAANEYLDIRYAEWNPRDERRILVYGQILKVSASSTDERATTGYWLVQLTPPLVIQLPSGSFHWQTNGLLGQASDYQLTLRNDQTLIREPKIPTLKDSLDDWRLKKLPHASGLILTRDDNAKQGLILPPGQWQFWSLIRGSLMLKDQNHWLWMDTNSNPTVSHEATGEWPIPMTVKRQTQYALKNNNEAWVWKQGQDPELVYRHSDSLVSIAWHPEGRDLMIATRNEILMFNLEARDGHQKTVLASFNEIKDASVVEDAILIVGKKGDQSGLWRLPLVLKSSTISPLDTFGL